MLRMFMLAAGLAIYLSGLSAAKPKAWLKAKVLSQEIGTQSNGAYAGPLLGGVFAIPLNRPVNRVVLETPCCKLRMVELGEKVIVLPVNGEIQYYLDRERVIILDTKKKKHKFALVGQTVKSSATAAGATK